MSSSDLAPSRIIFLDVDGVLNNPGTYAEDAAPWRRQPGEVLLVPVEAACMARLNRLVAKTGARIVISSSWRLFARWEDLGPALCRHGLVGEVIGETPDLVNDQPWLDAWCAREGAPFAYERITRGMEIARWLELHGGAVSSFVILDDCADMDQLADLLVLTDPTVGLDDPDVERAIRLLDASIEVTTTVGNSSRTSISGPSVSSGEIELLGRI